MKNGLNLGGAYEATLRRIKSQGGEKAKLGLAVLMWISHSRRPLQVDEICHAIAIRIGSNNLDSNNIPAISTLLACCQGLVTVEEGTSTVRLMHFTLQEYLCTHPDLFDGAHSTMAETCLTYLNFQRVKALSAQKSPDSRDTPFLEYSSLYWGTHMRMEPSDRAKGFALELLGQLDHHISAKSLWKSINGGLPFHRNPGDKPFSALHCISYFGIAEIANTLIKMKRWDVNRGDGAGMTPLIWAARHGHAEVVRLLLRKKHIQPDQQDTNYGRTALSWAAGNGHEEVVRLFFGSRFVSPGNAGSRWKKARRATSLLLGKKYINPDSSSESGRTPLSWAAQNGHEGIVKLLLGLKGVNPDTPDTKYGQTPLLWAAQHGHEEIVKQLLGREDVNPNSSSKSGRSPLSRAAENGHEGIVKLLLRRKDVKPDTLDTTYGQTPLLWATQQGHEGIVKLLLGQEDVNPDIADTRYGQTPLLWAAQQGHEGIAKLLLGREDVNPDSSSKSGRTPLSRAAEKGHEGIVKLLLGLNGVNPNTSDTKYSYTPLSWAAKNGREGVVKLLLRRRDIVPNSLSKSGRTPLTLAAKNGHDRVVELLQAHHPRHIR